MPKPRAGGKLPSEDSTQVVFGTKFGVHTKLSEIISFYVNGAKVDDRLKAQYDSAASAVHAWAYSIEKEWTAKGKTLAEVADICQQHIDNEMSAAQQLYCIEDEKAMNKTFSKFNAAQRKVIGTLRHGGSLSEYTTCTACANFNKEQNDIAIAKSNRQVAVSQLASAKGVSEEEASRMLDSQVPTEVVDNTASMAANDGMKLTELQKKFLEYATILEKCHGRNEDMIDAYLESIDSKIENLAMKLLSKTADDVLKAVS